MYTHAHLDVLERDKLGRSSESARAGRVRELTRSSLSKFKMVWHQFSTVQFPSHQFV